MKIIWKGVATGRSTLTVRVLLSPSNELIVESLSTDHMGGERWSTVSTTDTFNISGLSDLWMAAITNAIASMAKELGR